LNAGNRPGASVARCVGKGSDHTVKDFDVYCPKQAPGHDPRPRGGDQDAAQDQQRAGREVPPQVRDA
jgi:hypothetical protein